MIGICLPFDIRDQEIDRADNVSTIPLILGERTTRSAAIAMMLIYVLLLFVEYAIGMFNLRLFLPLIVSAVINTGFVVAASSKKSEYFFVAGLDGTMILQGLLIHLMGIIRF
jgi:4-hydroxybenzoate polyprenyltransferase